MKKYETLKELVEAVRAGEIDESKLVVIMDNDTTSVYLAAPKEDENDDCTNEIYKGGGYYDIEDLWPLLLPGASVEWC